MNTMTQKDDRVRDLKNAADAAGNSLEDHAHHAGQKVRELYDSASHEITHASEVVTKEIRTNPVRSSAIALGVGMLIGALIRR